MIETNIMAGVFPRPTEPLLKQRAKHELFSKCKNDDERNGHRKGVDFGHGALRLTGSAREYEKERNSQNLQDDNDHEKQLPVCYEICDKRVSLDPQLLPRTMPCPFLDKWIDDRKKERESDPNAIERRNECREDERHKGDE
jgi:hypothetical protein